MTENSHQFFFNTLPMDMTYNNHKYFVEINFVNILEKNLQINRNILKNLTQKIKSSLCH